MNSTLAPVSWTDANQIYLVEQFARLKKLLNAQSKSDSPSPDGSTSKIDTGNPVEALPAIERLAQVFELSAFERDIVLLAAGVEMDSELAKQCPRFTFGMAIATLPNPHWSALTPSRPLRLHHLIEIEPNHGLTCTTIRIDERILHYLAGLNQLDSRLCALIEPISAPDSIAQEHKIIAAQISSTLQQALEFPSLIQLCGDDCHGQEDAAAIASSKAGRQLLVLRAADLPPVGPDLDHFASLWERDSILLPGTLLIQCAANGISAPVRHLAERLPNLILAAQEIIHLNRALIRFDLNKPRPAEQKRLWKLALGNSAANLNGALDDVSEQFRLSARSIRSISSIVRPKRGQVDPSELWDVSRSFVRPRLENLARRLAPSASWDDIVLPELQIRTLHQLTAQVRHRMKVYETWGFSSKGHRGLGVSALFAGESGTGKTLAAEVLARDLNLDLYCIDLSAVVSKYIGETEKNLKQIFDAAEEGGALLLFDEADALFGKRGEVKDSHDRFANIEVGYLLQRMETYEGIAILTTNMKSSLDRSFQRRLRFIVNFPFPDAAQREAIWKRIFPAGTPTKSLDPRKLSQLKVAGGNIRNIALNAAFLAAATGKPVGMEQVLEAAGLEAEKTERPLSEAEIRGWL